MAVVKRIVLQDARVIDMRKFSGHSRWFRRLRDAASGEQGVIYPAALMTSFALGLTNLGIIFFAREIFRATPAQVGWLAGTRTPTRFILAPTQNTTEHEI